jgi:GMP synthase (glutamine-hydrolysing)
MVQAMLRTCQTHGIAATVARTGDADAGAVLVKQNLMGDGFRVLAQIRSADGAAGWLRGTGQEAVAEAAADAYIARQVARDSDVWVLEIEDRAGRLPFDEKVV